MADDLDGLRALHAPFADLVQRAIELTGEP